MYGVVNVKERQDADRKDICLVPARRLAALAPAASSMIPLAKIMHVIRKKKQ